MHQSTEARGGRGGLISSRSTGELLVLMIAATVCFSVLAGGATVGFVEIRNPEVDTTAAIGLISDTINTLIGVMAGFLAGRTEAKRTEPV